jgi:hypothetical protein
MMRDRFGDPRGQPPWLLVLAGPVLLGPGLRLLRTPPKEASPDLTATHNGATCRVLIGVETGQISNVFRRGTTFLALPTE